MKKKRISFLSISKSDLLITYFRPSHFTPTWFNEIFSKISWNCVFKKQKKMLNGKVKFWTDLKYFEISIFRCSFADLKNDAIRELSHQIIIFASFVHHCDFRFVRKQFFEEKNWKKNHWRQKTSEFIFVWKKNCYEFALHQDLPSQSLAQELPKKELQRKKKFQKSYIIWRRFKFWVKLSTTDLSLKCRREKEIEPTGIGTRTRKNRRILCWNLSIMLKMCLKKSGWKFSSIAIKSAWIIWKWLVLHSTISLIPMQLNMVFHQLSIIYFFKLHLIFL